MMKLTKQITPVKILVFTACVVALMSAWTWWQYVYNSPTRAFWGMVSQSMSTGSYGKVVVQDAEGEHVRNASVADLTARQIANGQTMLDRQSAGDSMHVVTDTVSTPKADYIRYTTIQTNQKSTATGQPLDFSQVAGKWGYADGTAGGGQLYGDLALGIVPVGQLSLDARNGVLSTMKSNNAYSFKLAKTESGLLGRKTYTYDVTVNIKGYVRALKQYSQAMGLKNLDSIDPEAYTDDQTASVQIRVDSWSRQIKAIVYPDSERTEQIVGQGTEQELAEVPTTIVDINELQQLLGQIR